LNITVRAWVGVGPQIGYIFPLGNYQGYLNLKGYEEFDGHDRPSGCNAWLTLSISSPLTGLDGGGGIQLGRRLRRRCFRGMDRDIGVELGDPCGAGDPGPGAEEFMQTVYESAVALRRMAHCSVSDTPGYCGHGAGKNLR
jgi:hypothetical protein